tara:strand:+ start:333 stop:710 length:378 start_codon:yes stop_codon:yes gene_type:complete
MTGASLETRPRQGFSRLDAGLLLVSGPLEVWVRFADVMVCLDACYQTRSQIKQSMMRLVLAVVILASGAPAMAGAGVGQSIWKQGQAYQRAIKNKPADAKVTSSNCHANYSSGENTVYTCTVMWD